MNKTGLPKVRSYVTEESTADCTGSISYLHTSQKDPKLESYLKIGSL